MTIWISREELLQEHIGGERQVADARIDGTHQAIAATDIRDAGRAGRTFFAEAGRTP